MITWSILTADGSTTVVARKGPYWVAAMYQNGASDYEIQHWQKWAERTLENLVKLPSPKTNHEFVTGYAQWCGMARTGYGQYRTLSYLRPDRILGHVILDAEDRSMIALRVIVRRNGKSKEYIVGEFDGHVYIAVYPYLSDLRVCQTIAPR